MPFTIAIFVLSIAGFARPGESIGSGEKAKPACAAASVGKMWPDQANRDTTALRLAAQSGELELCGKRRDGYHWQSVSVNVRQLRDSVGLGDVDLTYAATPDDIPDDGPERDMSKGSDRRRHRFQTLRRILGM